MSVSPVLREKMYRAYTEFFDMAEQKRRWNPLRDIPWDKLDPSKNREQKALCVETFCGVELYVPDYTANGFTLTRSLFGHAWFQANWGYEESKHALVFREYLVRSGMRTQAQYDAFEDRILGQVWNLPFHTRRQMTCYGALQEAATYLIYRAQRERAAQEGDEVLKTLYFYVSRDEAAHMGFYRQVLQFEAAEDRQGTLEDLAHVLHHFRMPGVGLIPGYDERLQVEGIGVTPQVFLELGVYPTLRKLGVSRTELVKARRSMLARAAATREEAGAGALAAVAS